MPWVIVAGAILGGISSYSQERSSQKAADKAARNNLEAVREGGKEDRKTFEFQAGLTDYMQQLERDRKRKGLANFNQWSRLENYTPEYVPPEMGDRPTAQGFEEGNFSLVGSMRKNTPGGV